MVCKDGQSPYEEGIRNRKWLKVKIKRLQDAVICGIILAGKDKDEFGGLVLGADQGKHLVYVGQTDFGFNGKLNRVLSRLFPLVRKDSPLTSHPKFKKPVAWVEPCVLCEIQFSEWTKNGLMLHPMFLSLKRIRINKRSVIASKA